jgi:hypothetical protein
MRKTHKIRLTGEAAATAIREFKVRLAGNLYRRLVQQAERHGHTLNGEINRRLEDSLEQGERRNLDEIISDLRINWVRFQARFLRMDLGDQLADSVLKGTDAAQTRMLAQMIVRHRSDEQRGLGGNAS